MHYHTILLLPLAATSVLARAAHPARSLDNYDEETTLAVLARHLALSDFEETLQARDLPLSNSAALVRRKTSGPAPAPAKALVAASKPILKKAAKAFGSSVVESVTDRLSGRSIESVEDLEDLLYIRALLDEEFDV